MTLLPIVTQVDNFSAQGSNGYYSLISQDGRAVIGYLTKQIADLFDQEAGFEVEHPARTVKIGNEYDTLEARNKLFGDVALRWRELEFFESELKHGWRNELYTVYYPHNQPYILIERAFSVLLGVITYGVHINGYVPKHKSSDGKLKLWIPRRAPDKPTYPGMLDNTVAGGLGYPHGIWTTVVKECFEEAGLPEDFVRQNARSAGVVAYMHQVAENIERVQPEVEYIYDIEFGDETSVVPHPEDGEAEDFRLLSVDEVIQRLRDGEFKPNCGLVIVDFLIRHGIVTPETEPHYLEIVSRCHRKMPFPTM